MDLWVVAVVLGGALAALWLFLQLRPWVVAYRLGRHPAHRSVCVPFGRGIGGRRAIFLVEVRGLPGRHAVVRAALAAETEATDPLRAALARALAAGLADHADTLGTPLPTPAARAAASALERIGLDPVRLDPAAWVKLDARLARLEGLAVHGVTRGGYQGHCEALELYLDGVSGLGEWCVTAWEGGRQRFLRSTEWVVRPEARLKVSPSAGGNVEYRSLADLLGDG